MASLHGEVSCTYCHGGNNTTDDKTASHIGMVRDPSDKCADCHRDISNRNETSLHTTMNGMITALTARGGDLSEGSILSMAFETSCNTCHTSCGQCHISRGDNFHGGLIDNHNILNPPSEASTCYACHGARPGPEYYGAVDLNIPGDLHYDENMACTTCHTKDQMHGPGFLVSDMSQNPAGVKCIDCHQDIRESGAMASNLQHMVHLNTLQCQVCHAGAYKNCYTCHVGIDDKGLAYHTTGESEISFKIGLNPNPSEFNPEKYVLLRHVPVAVDTFAAYGDNLLPKFDEVSAWHRAAPHNIQLKTPQNASCNSCHGHPELFFTESDIIPGESAADAKIVVTHIPTPLPGMD